MNILKELNRNVASPLMMILGGDRFIRSFASGSILNVMYHGVTRNNTNYFSPRHISSDQFERHLKYFSKEFNVISLSEAFRYQNEKYRPERKTLTISFDDGYRNNLYTALPLLEKYNLKATFFISGVCTEEMKLRTLWTDIISTLSYFHRDKIIELRNRRFKNLKDTETRISLGDFLASCEKSVLNDCLNQLMSKYDLENEINTLPDETWKLLDCDELRELSSSPLAETGSHGYSHYKLAEIELATAAHELELSKESLQNVIDKEVNIVAYPFGSYNEAIKDLAEKLGYTHQLAVDYISADDVTDQRILNRHGVPSTTTYEANILLLNNAFRKKGF